MESKVRVTVDETSVREKMISVSYPWQHSYRPGSMDALTNRLSNCSTYIPLTECKSFIMKYILKHWQDSIVKQ